MTQPQQKGRSSACKDGHVDRVANMWGGKTPQSNSQILKIRNQRRQQQHTGDAAASTRTHRFKMTQLRNRVMGMLKRRRTVNMATCGQQAGGRGLRQRGTDVEAQLTVPSGGTHIDALRAAETRQHV
jgi:hypothetical protein